MKHITRKIKLTKKEFLERFTTAKGNDDYNQKEFNDFIWNDCYQGSNSEDRFSFYISGQHVFTVTQLNNGFIYESPDRLDYYCIEERGKKTYWEEYEETLFEWAIAIVEDTY